MLNSTDDVLSKLISRLAEIDERDRESRAKRIVWASQHRPRFAWTLGTVEAMSLMAEARETYVFGQYMACVVLATAYIEHTLVHRLQVAGLVKKFPVFSQAILIARENNLYAGELLDRCDHLREIRNPFTHKRPDNDPNTLSNRYLVQRKHPQLVLEADAQDALVVMYKFFSPIPARA